MLTVAASAGQALEREPEAADGLAGVIRTELPPLAVTGTVVDGEAEECLTRRCDKPADGQDLLLDGQQRSELATRLAAFPPPPRSNGPAPRRLYRTRAAAQRIAAAATGDLEGFR
jgi:hypothetical protein